MTDKLQVSFDDICNEVKLSTKDPLSDGYDKYIGLEHLDSGSLKINRWGYIAEDSPSFTRVFKKGQILFGKRRPYLKKAGIAEFDGICSGDIIVMEPKKSLHQPEILPYVIQSEKFWSWAVKNSSGSLSPRTKFSILKKLLINLPENKAQESCLEILDQAQKSLCLIDELIEHTKKTKIKVAYEQMLKGNWYQQLFFKKDLIIPSGWSLKTVGNILESTQYGLNSALSTTGKYPVLRMMNITNGYVDPNNMKFLNCSDDEANKYLLNQGDLVFNRTNSMEWVGRTGIFEQKDDYLFASYLIRLVVDSDMISSFYLNQYLNLPLVQYRLKAFATPGVNQANINPGSLKSMPILLPPMNEIKKIDELMREFDQEIIRINVQKEHAIKLFNNLKTKFFS